jgi:hypothetical protein
LIEQQLDQTIYVSPGTGDLRNQTELATPSEMAMVTKVDPPALMKGSGNPVTGAMPTVIPMFT